MRKATLLALGMVLLVVGAVACAAPAAAVTGSKVAVAGGAYTNATPAQLKQMLASKDFFLVNVHVPYAGELPQTDAFIPYTDIDQNLSKLPADKNAKIALYCSSGHMSGIAANTLVKLGYTNIWSVDGGMAAWQNAGYDLVQKKQ